MKRVWLFGVFLAGVLNAQEDRSGDTITFSLTQNVIFAEGTVNGQGPFSFIVDTGASLTILRPATAEKLGLKKKGRRPSFLDIFSGPSFVTVDSIGLGKALVMNLPVGVMMVPQADIPLAFAQVHYDGILGYNYLSQYVTTLDYKKRELKLVPNDYVPEDPSQMLEKLKTVRREPVATAGFSYRNGEEGIVVRALAKGGSAEKADLRGGDLLVEIDGRRVKDADSYRKLLADAKPGQTWTLTVLRDKRQESIKLILGARP